MMLAGYHYAEPDQVGNLKMVRSSILARKESQEPVKKAQVDECGPDPGCTHAGVTQIPKLK